MAKKRIKASQQDYKNIAKKNEPKRPVLKNTVIAYLVGGFICTIGQAIQMIFIKYFDFKEAEAGNPTVAVLIIVSVLLTGLGVYDKIAQKAGAGTAVPITGFANSISSAAIEHRSEGYVLGVGANMFKIAGSVISFGVFSAFVIAIIKIILKGLGVL